MPRDVCLLKIQENYVTQNAPEKFRDFRETGMICWVPLFQIDPAYKMEPGKDKSETGCAPYTLVDGIAISNRPLEEEDENNRVKKVEMMEKMEWLRSLEGR